MVEVILDDIARQPGPNPTHELGRNHGFEAQVSPINPPHSSQTKSDVFHDTKVSDVQIISDWIGKAGPDLDTRHTNTLSSMEGDTSNRGTRDRSGINQRPRHSHATVANRSQNVQSIPSSSPHLPSSPHGQRPPPSAFPVPTPHYTPHTPPYNMRGPFFSPYMVPAQLPSNMPPRPFHPATAPESSVTSQNVSPGHHPVFQSQTPVYQYQPQSSDDSSTSSYPSPSGSPPFASYSPSNINPTLSPSVVPSVSPYISANHLRTLGYPSPALPQHPYQQQFPTPPPMYQPYPSLHYPSSPEVDPQSHGAWYYLPHNAPTQQQFEGPHYGSAYPIPYQPISHGEEGSLYLPALLPRPPSNPFPSPYRNPAIHAPPEQLTSYIPPMTRSTPASHTEASTSSSGTHSAGAKPVVRQAWHPKPPAHRSPWVMWVGNVPSDANHEELWKFFTQAVEGRVSEDDEGVDSIFLISRSNCAFINYNSEASLKAAIANSHGKPLRPYDPRCAKLVCRTRRTEEDLKSGVGGQRGMGIHMQWVKDQKATQSSEASDLSTSDDPSASPTSVPDHLAHVRGSVHNTRDGDKQHPKARHSSSSGSYASTNSSFLSEHFPQRYFILKSLTQYDLDLSVQSGLWATQKHNEGILDQAFRTSKDVYLIFSVNKSGEFFGYARMTGPIIRGEASAPWATRPDASTSTSPFLSPENRKANPGSQDRDGAATFFSPDGGHLVEDSPMPVRDVADTASEVDGIKDPDVARHHHSAPANFGTDRDVIERAPSLKFSLDYHERRMKRKEGQFELDPSGPMRAMRIRQGIVAPQGEAASTSKTMVSDLAAVNEVEVASRDDFSIPKTGRDGDVWGDCFKLEWISTRKVPFYRARHLRNPWNKGREVKVSRDGTELEPAMGMRLLGEWETLADQHMATVVATGTPLRGDLRRGASKASPTDHGVGPSHG